MDLRDVLSEQDKIRLKNYINIYSGANVECQDVNKVLTEWAHAKIDLYHILGDKLIVEFPFEYTRPFSEISDECYNTIYGYDVTNPAYREMFTALDTYWTPIKEAKASLEDDDGTILWEVSVTKTWPSSIFNDCDIIASNILPEWLENYTVRNKETGKEITFHKGEKYFRALGKLIHNCPLNDEVFESFRIKMSQITNQKILKGTMCISIHPMDYVTMSDNDYDWDSCMNWATDEGGDYRLGTVEMMNSSMVVCAYLKGDRDFQWGHYHIKDDPDYSWNSKKWRELFIVRPDFNIEIKAYPYDNEEFTKVVMAKLEELMGDAHEEEIYWNYKTRFNDDNLELGFQTNENGMYNDFGTFRNQKGHLMRYNKKLVNEWTIDKFNRKYVNYSGEPHCMCCGALINSYEAQSNQVVCGNCGDYIVEKCSCCGCSIYDDDDVFWSYDDGPYCFNCYNDLYVHDDIMDEDIRREDAIQFCLMDHETALDTTTIDTVFGPKYKINDYLNRVIMSYATYDELISEFELAPHTVPDRRPMNSFPTVYYYTYDEIIYNDALLNFFGFVADNDKLYQARGRNFYATNISKQVLNLKQQIEAYKHYNEPVWYRERKSDVAPYDVWAN